MSHTQMHPRKATRSSTRRAWTRVNAGARIVRKWVRVSAYVLKKPILMGFLPVHSLGTYLRVGVHLGAREVH